MEWEESAAMYTLAQKKQKSWDGALKFTSHTYVHTHTHPFINTPKHSLTHTHRNAFELSKVESWYCWVIIGQHEPLGISISHCNSLQSLNGWVCMCAHQYTLMRAVVEMIALAANLQVLASNTTLRETIQVAREEVRKRHWGGGWGNRNVWSEKRKNRTDTASRKKKRERERDR